MAGRHLRNRSITIVADSIGRRGSNEVDLISLDNAAVNQEAETDGIVMWEREGNNSDSMASTEVRVCMSTRQLQDLLTNAISTLRMDIVTIIKTNNSKFQVECSKLRSDFVTITEQLNCRQQQRI
jgi:hypothetical protein